MQYVLFITTPGEEASNFNNKQMSILEMDLYWNAS